MKKLEVSVFIFLIIWTLMGCISTKPTLQQKTGGAVVHRPSGIAFPERIESLKLVEKTEFNQSGTDFGVKYESFTGIPLVVDVFIFPAATDQGDIELETIHALNIRSVEKIHPDAIIVDDKSENDENTNDNNVAITTFSYKRSMGKLPEIVASILFDMKDKGWFISYRIDVPYEKYSEILYIIEATIIQIGGPNFEYSLALESK
jgi:hypothetical protein